MAHSVHPVDEVLPAPRLTALGLQHVLVMYAGAVAVPLIVGRALELTPQQIAFLINADLFACGLVTLVQSLGFPGVGIRLPVMMGVTFASVGPMLAMVSAGKAAGLPKEQTLNLIYGSVIAAGIFGVLISPFISRMIRFFPPVVTGTIILVIGISLMRIGINWAAGAPVDTIPSYGDPVHLGVAAFVLLVILALTKFGSGFIANVAVLLGIIAGSVLALIIGKMGFDKVAAAPWFEFVMPFQFGMPIFDFWSIVTMCLVMIVVMIESLGMFLAIGTMTGRTLSQDDLTRGLRADGVGTIIGGVFNTFPYTSFSQNVGLVGVTGVRSRWVCIAGGIILLLLGLTPKLAQLVESVPTFVLGGAGIVMFGMVAATGIRILSAVDYASNRNNLYIVAISVGFGMIPLVAPKFFQYMPKAVGPLLHSGILLAAIVAVILNLYFNGVKSQAEAEAEAAASSHGSE
ncbi:MAG TPA: nucleobase:cation symporter-2 family protein [Beijerinckiaceae bacterium]|nr:nucleobase:cation symporter-2 family protein [Beijerinckiaceae bacterium]